VNSNQFLRIENIHFALISTKLKKKKKKKKLKKKIKEKNNE
jgi:hypothetical protein